MGFDFRVLVYVAAAAALVLGILASGIVEEEHGDHEEEGGLLASDPLKVVAVGVFLAVVAAISLMYLAKKGSNGG